jgi:ABC-type nitrate/sulfonate/bicarbonate transport system substrate-binding protein
MEFGKLEKRTTVQIKTIFQSVCRTSRAFTKSRNMALAILIAFGISPRLSRADNLKIGYGAFSLGYALIWITKEGRLFDKNGLDVDVLYLESNLVRTALISGDVPIGAMSGAAMATPRLQGADLVVILGFQNFLPFRFVVRPEIKSVAGLRRWSTARSMPRC